MKKVVIPVAFGTLDQETFNRSYRPLFSLFTSADIRPAFLHAGASGICGVPLFDDVLKTIETDTSVTVFPLILNDGKEYSEVQEQCGVRGFCLLPPLLQSMKVEVAESLKKQCCSPEVDYLLLGHGSRFCPQTLYQEVMSLMPSNVQLLLHHGANGEIPSRITTVPLMLINGRHIKAMNSELAQDHEVTAVENGLLDDPDFRNAVFERIKGCL